MEVTLYGWKLLVLIDARTKIPLAAQVVPIQEHETLCLRALVTQARTNVGGKARRHKVVFDRGFLDGADLWWLDLHGITCVVPANTTLAVTVDARAQAALEQRSRSAVGCTRYGMGTAEQRRPNGWRPRSWASPG
jgi:hypothetical protein